MGAQRHRLLLCARHEMERHSVRGLCNGHLRHLRCSYFHSQMHYVPEVIAVWLVLFPPIPRRPPSSAHLASPSQENVHMFSCRLCGAARAQSRAFLSCLQHARASRVAPMQTRARWRAIALSIISSRTSRTFALRARRARARRQLASALSHLLAARWCGRGFSTHARWLLR